MFSHITLGTNDLTRAAAFYRTVMPIVGLPVCQDHSENGFVGFGPEGRDRSEFFICRPWDEKSATVGNGVSVAFSVSSRDSVDAFHAAAMLAGGKDEGAPGLRPQYDSDYYAAYVRDLDGNKICCVCRDPI